MSDPSAPNGADGNVTPRKRDRPAPARNRRGHFLPGHAGGPGRVPGSPAPATRWRQAMFSAWLDGGLSAGEVQMAWLQGGAVTLASGEVLDFGDGKLSTAERWLQLQRLFVQLAPREVAISGEIDPDARAAATARDRGIAAVMEGLLDELEARRER